MIIRTSTIAALFAVFAAFTVLFEVCPAPAPKTRVEATYTVQEGDTLWGIAEQYCGDTYILEYIEDLKGINPGLTSNIQSGKRIRIVYYVKGAK